MAMKLDPVWPATRGESGLVVEDRVRFRNYLRVLPQEIEVVVRPRRRNWKQRSGQENRYYWGVVIAILADHLGMDADETHEALKIEFLSERRDDGLVRVRQSSSLSTVEFEDYLERVRRAAAMGRFGESLEIPLPNEVEVRSE